MKFNEYAGLTVSTWWITISVLVSEIYGPFKTLLATIFTHHWVGKGVVAAVIFIIAGYLYKSKKMFGKPLEKLAWQSVMLSLAIIFAFFIIHYYL